MSEDRKSSDPPRTTSFAKEEIHGDGYEQTILARTESIRARFAQEQEGREVPHPEASNTTARDVMPERTASFAKEVTTDGYAQTLLGRTAAIQARFSEEAQGRDIPHREPAHTPDPTARSDRTASFAKEVTTDDYAKTLLGRTAAIQARFDQAAEGREVAADRDQQPAGETSAPDRIVSDGKDTGAGTYADKLLARTAAINDRFAHDEAGKAGIQEMDRAAPSETPGSTQVQDHAPGAHHRPTGEIRDEVDRKAHLDAMAKDDDQSKVFLERLERLRASEQDNAQSGVSNENTLSR